jgi:hypothetical protein
VPAPPRPWTAQPGPAAAAATAAAAAEPPAKVAAALAKLDVLDGRPVGEHVAVYDEVHRLLQDALASLDER